MRNYRHRILNRIRKLESLVCITPEVARELHHLRSLIGLEAPAPLSPVEPVYLAHSTWWKPSVQVTVIQPEVIHRKK